MKNKLLDIFGVIVAGAVAAFLAVLIGIAGAWKFIIAGVVLLLIYKGCIA